MIANRQHLTASQVGSVVAFFSQFALKFPEYPPPLAEIHITPDSDEDWADLSDLDLSALLWDYRSFSDSILERIIFKNMLLNGVMFRTAVLRDVSFYHTELRGVGFRSAVLERVSFYGAVLRDVWFYRATLNTVNFYGAYLKNVKFDITDLNKVIGIRQFDAPHSRNNNPINAWYVDEYGCLAESGTLMINQGCFTGTLLEAQRMSVREYNNPQRQALALKTLEKVEKEMLA
jgi:uncharacterized protein YjbI with pentapeptide repeats